MYYDCSNYIYIIYIYIIYIYIIVLKDRLAFSTSQNRVVEPSHFCILYIF